MADNPNVGPDPVEAEPNHKREKTYKAPNTPEPVQEERAKLPENAAQDRVREDVSDAVDAIKAKL